jgi:predicted Fe-Mo cluster-binding NifX family protein
MKIALVTDDGRTISQHFGRATHYMVITVENGNIVNREMREKAGHAKFHSEGHGHEESGQVHGFGPASDHKHGQMADTITDCEAVLCRGMGQGAYESMQSRNIRPVVTDFANIDDAVKAYIDGQIVDHIEKLH